jgi:hypothetical protein
MSEALQNNTPEVEEIDVRSDIEAGWQLKRRKEIISDRDELIAFYKGRIKAVEEDAAFKIGSIDRSLYAFFMTVPHKKTKTQESYTHPLGKLMMKKQNPEFKRDEKTVIDWLKKNNGGEFIKVEESLDWSALKGATTVLGNSIVTADGETVPGVEVVEREDKFCVE